MSHCTTANDMFHLLFNTYIMVVTFDIYLIRIIEDTQHNFSINLLILIHGKKKRKKKKVQLQM